MAGQNGPVKAGALEERLAPIYVPGTAEGEQKTAAKGTDSSSDGSESSSDGGEGAATGSAAMAEFQKHWDAMSVQARTTAKWIATALGAGLAALVGTAPLSALQGKEIPHDALIVAAFGLVALGLTIFLVLRVLVPGITGFGDLMGTERREQSPFHELQEKAASGDGVMLPIGIESLAELGKRAEMEAETLNELAIAISDEDTTGAAKGCELSGA
jgi:hypothetical protein